MKVKVIPADSEFDKEPYFVWVTGNILKELQSIVGGYLEAVYLTADTQMLVNEDGLTRDVPLPANTRAMFEHSKTNTTPYTPVLVGNAILVGLKETEDDQDWTNYSGT